MGEGVFIGPKSSERPVLKAYIRYLSTAVRKLFCTIRYYPVYSVNSITYVRQSGVHLLYCSHSTIVLFAKRTYGGGPPYVRTTDNSVHSALKDKSVHLSTLAYVCTKRQTR
jgi:hypothetical protein